MTRTAWSLAGALLGAGVCGAQAPAPPPPGPPAVNPAPPAPLPPAPPARFVPRVATHADTVRGKAIAVLTINEREAATVRTDAGGLTAQQRADIAASRLTSLLQGGLTAGEIIAQPADKPLWQVAARGGTLLLATPEEAQAHQGMSPEDLARAWVKALRTLITEPPLTLSASSLIVPFGEARTVKVGGAALPADVQAGSDDSRISAVNFDPARRLLTIRGQTTGRCRVTVALPPSDGNVALSIPVSVMKYAGQVAPSTTVQVTGSPAAPPDVITQAEYAGLTRVLSLEDGAQVALSNPPRLTESLAAGAQTPAVFPLRLSGPDLLPVTARIAVNVVNVPIRSTPPVTLFYSNNPEQVKHSQILFTARLRPLATTRLDYHHQNMSGALLVFHVDLLNDSDTPASVQVIAGLSLPGGDTVQVGRRAGAAFLKNLNADAGLVLPVPPHGHTSLVTQRFGPGLTVSGIMQIQSLSGPALTVRVNAGGDTDALAAPLARVYQTGTGGSALAAPSDAAPPDSTGPPSPYVFPRPQVALSDKYVVDKRWAFIPMGDKDALRDASGKLKLFGNYGADYDVSLTLTNPTPDTRQVGVYFSPGAGPAAGVFQIDDGPILEYDPFEAPDERELERITLAPGETKVTHVRTIPLNGSAYPAQLVARALDKRPAPPAPPPATSATPAAPAVTETVGPVRKASP